MREFVQCPWCRTEDPGEAGTLRAHSRVCERNPRVQARRRDEAAAQRTQAAREQVQRQAAAATSPVIVLPEHDVALSVVVDGPEATTFGLGQDGLPWRPSRPAAPRRSGSTWHGPLPGAWLGMVGAATRRAEPSPTGRWQVRYTDNASTPYRDIWRSLTIFLDPEARTFEALETYDGD